MEGFSQITFSGSLRILSLQENEKEKEDEGDEKKDDCTSCKNDQEVVFIQVKR